MNETATVNVTYILSENHFYLKLNIPLEFLQSQGLAIGHNYTVKLKK